MAIDQTEKKRRAGKGRGKDRDGEQFVAIPMVVLNSPAFIHLSPRAVKLLLDIASQNNGRNNGRLLASKRFMTSRGWTSVDQLTKALHELLEHRLIEQTVRGHMPNKASWFGVTWQGLEPRTDYDMAMSGWPRSAYMNWKPPAIPPKKRPPPKSKRPDRSTDLKE
nr:hypothetical protein [uncultured Deefgea sp.]